MRAILIAASFSLIIALLGTPAFIKFLIRKEYGQFVRDDGPNSHHTKRGTPTMGGAIIIAGAVIAYAAAHLLTWSPPSPSGLLVMFLMTGLGAVGFADDFIKIRKARSLGLRSWEKLIGQAIVGITFAVLALNFPDGSDLTPASTKVSFVRDTLWQTPDGSSVSIDLAFAGTGVGLVLFIIWANLLIAGTSNGVNLSDGLDGLATGACVMVFGAYVLISIWQFNQSCAQTLSNKCYEVRDPYDLAVVAAAVMGACFGFLWWNASPAQIFMGDTGSLALGGALAGLAITSRTEVLLVIIGGLFVLETLSVILQVGSFKLRKKRIFRIAPIHHHFEMVGWSEVNVVIRFWIICGLFVATGVGIFYAEWVVSAP